MIKTITLFCLILISQFAFAQADSIDIKLQTILAEKNAETRMDLLNIYLGDLADYDPLLTQNVVQKFLTIAKKNKDTLSETYAISQLSFLFYLNGDNTKSLEYSLKALKMAEPLNNATLLAVVKNHLAVSYTYLDSDKEIEMLRQALLLRDKAPESQVFYLIALNIGEYFSAVVGNLDSALVYNQLAERIHQQKLRIDKKVFIYMQFAKLYFAMNNPTLSYTYSQLALKKAYEMNSPKYLNWCFTQMATFYASTNKTDSAIFYSKKALKIVENRGFLVELKYSAFDLMNFYKNKNNDSSMKYAEIYLFARDSIESLNKTKESYLLSFEEEIRQNEIKEKEVVREHERKQNIQFALLAIGIIFLLTLFLLLSRSFITNSKVIEFFGAVALLIVFEFLNLLLHPFLEKITHHNPFLMLLSLVCIAAVLVPLHHKIEKWATSKLIEKNKAIRLANAKKTIEDLEKN